MHEDDRKNDGRAEALDSLTGLANRHGLIETLAREVGRSHDDGTRLALIVLDVDNFKRFNDDFGYAVADDALKGIADCIRQVVSPTDAAFRVGGDEFVVVLPASTLQDAMALSTRLLGRIADQPLEPLRGINLSYGIVELAEGEDPMGLFIRADHALLRAKRPPPAEPSGVREPRRPKPSGGSASVRKPLPGS
jgi:diguanylate cyclase (GGDEF)-like protein